jgi:hypothetical protein
MSRCDPVATGSAGSTSVAPTGPAPGGVLERSVAFLDLVLQVATPPRVFVDTGPLQAAHGGAGAQLLRAASACGADEGSYASLVVRRGARDAFEVHGTRAIATVAGPEPARVTGPPRYCLLLLVLVLALVLLWRAVRVPRRPPPSSRQWQDRR